MVKYNNQAFDRLKEALGCKSYPMLLDRLEELGIRKVSLPTFYTWRDEGKIPMETLILICNNAHFPLSYFFVSDQADDKRAYTVIPERDWRKVFFFPERLFLIIKRTAKPNDSKNLRRFRKHVKEFNDGDFHAMARLFVADVLEICSESGIHLGDFLYDLNVPLPEEDDVLVASADSFREVICSFKEEVIRMTEQMEAQSRTIRELKAEIRREQDENALLQKRNNELIEDLQSATENNINQSLQKVKLLEEIKEERDKIKELQNQLRNRDYYEKTKQKK